MIVNGVEIFLTFMLNSNMETAFDIWVYLGSISDTSIFCMINQNVLVEPL